MAKFNIKATTKTVDAVAGLVGSVGNVATGLVALAGTAVALYELISAAIAKAKEKNALDEVPEIYSPNYHLKLKAAKRWLKKAGFKVEPIIAQPNVALADCLDLEVVDTNIKPGQKVNPGTRIVVVYVTTKVIEDSRKLFMESQRQKAEIEQKKAEK